MGSAMKGGEILALFGPLGAGKTALVRGMAAGLDAPSTAVSSPTFVLIHEYHGRLPLAHVDLYRLPSARDIESIGLQEYLTGPTVAAIEWADKGLPLYRDGRRVKVVHPYAKAWEWLVRPDLRQYRPD